MLLKILFKDHGVQKELLFQKIDRFETYNAICKYEHNPKTGNEYLLFPIRNYSHNSKPDVESIVSSDDHVHYDGIWFRNGENEPLPEISDFTVAVIMFENGKYVSYAFQEAYLMNDKGDTIRKYHFCPE